MTIEHLVRPNVLRMKGYEPKDSLGLRMDMNTNIIEENPAIKKAMSKIKDLKASQYPDNDAINLKKSISKKYGLTPDNILVGNGTNELLDVIMKTFIEPKDTLLVPFPTFPMYAFYAQLAGGKVAQVRLDKNFQLPERFLSVNHKVVIVPSPANPSGNMMKHRMLERLIERPGITVIDEIYADFCDQNFMSRVNEWDNLIVLRGFSKAHGLAGLRVGFCAASANIIKYLSRVRAPYSVNAIAQKAALESLNNASFMKRLVSTTIKERDYITNKLQKMGFKSVPSDANFIFTKCPFPSAKLVLYLNKRGILIKDFGGSTKDYVRITVGTRAMNDTLLDSVNMFLEKNQKGRR